MTAAVRIQPQGFSVQYPKPQWRVSFVEDAAGKFRFLLCGHDFKFEPRDRYRYPSITTIYFLKPPIKKSQELARSHLPKENRRQFPVSVVPLPDRV